MAGLQSLSSLSVTAARPSLSSSVEAVRGGVCAFEACRLKRSTYNELLLTSISARGPAAPLSRRPFRCLATAYSVPTVADTKAAFLNKFCKPIPSIYNNVIQELLVQQHLMRYNQTYKYDAVFALGFVTVYNQLMDGYPSESDREAIFKAYVEALNEDPEQYRKDAKRLEEWASSKTAETLVSFSPVEGEVESILKDISHRAADGKFHYSRFFAIGLFRLLERANATDPTVLEQLSNKLNVSKLSVDRDLDVYRNLLSKLVQAKELLKEYVEREKAKQAQREANSNKSSEAVAKIESVFL